MSYSKNYITEFEIDFKNEKLLSKIFPKVEKENLLTIGEKYGDKLKNLKIDYLQNDIYDKEEFIRHVAKIASEINIEYEKIGIKETYDKIIKIYKLLKNDADRQLDFQIVSEIKNEYIENKKLSKSNMLYLNKLNREISGNVG